MATAWRGMHVLRRGHGRAFLKRVGLRARPSARPAGSKGSGLGAASFNLQRQHRCGVVLMGVRAVAHGVRERKTVKTHSSKRREGL